MKRAFERRYRWFCSVVVVAHLIGLGCGSTAIDPVEQALAPVRAKGALALSECAAIAFADLSIPCFVEVAARAGRLGDEALARESCASLPSGPWADECHFRAGEEFGRIGRLPQALGHCLQAGGFARFCLTHVAWNLPPTNDVTSGMDPKLAVVTLERERIGIEALLEGASDGLDGEGRDLLRSRRWFNAYVGTGIADPALAKAAPDALAPYARGAWAIETARLLFPPGVAFEQGAVQKVVDAWSGDPVLRGTTLGIGQRVGRYTPPVPSPHEQALAKVPVYGGGFRLVGLDVSEDVTLAALEALFFLAETPAEVFETWLADDRPRVRWTAARLVSSVAGRGLDREEILAPIRAHADEAVRWHAEFVPSPALPKTGERPQ